MAYTTIDDPTDYFRVKLYAGNATNDTAITWDETDTNMQPDWLWGKSRTDAQAPWMFDSVRGATLRLLPYSGDDEGTENTNLDSFDTNGFQVDNEAIVNGASRNYVVWGWKAGTSFTNDASSTGIGGVDSAGSFNNAAGFSIVTYNGNAGNTTVKHGMNVAPKMIIFKRRDANSTNWYTYHGSLGQGKRLVLNTTAAEAADTEYMNNTAPTTSVFSLGPSGTTNTTGNHLAYCFAEIKGYSKFGSYTGNGNANGTFVYTGQKSRFIMIKAASRTGTWNIYDTKRNPHNNIQDFHVANVAEADVTGNTYQNIDILSNGFKCYGTGSGTNESGATYIFMAFAENPFVTSTGIPATAR
jgi:hypothetical protein